MESGGRETRIARRQGTRSEADARAAGRNSKTRGESSLEPRLAPALDRLPQQLGQERAVVGGKALFGHEPIMPIRGRDGEGARLGRDIDIDVSDLPTYGSPRVIVGNRDPRAVL
jgi:hypothetical protein